MKLLFNALVVSLLFFSIQVQSQSVPPKLSGTISHEYVSRENPIKISYKIHPYGGSGNYSFQWKTQKGGFIKDETTSGFTYNFDCQKNKRPRMIVYCLITDIDNGKKKLIKIEHPIEFCL